MNEHKHALNRIESLEEVTIKKLGKEYKMVRSSIFIKDIEKLKELVERATPKKPIKSEDYEIGLCPHCQNYHIYDYEYDVRFDHCVACGQTIDWSEDDQHNEQL